MLRTTVNSDDHMSTKRMGQLGFWLCPMISDWAIDANAYNFRMMEHEIDGIWVDVKKHPDRTLEVILHQDSGPLAEFRVSLPELQQAPHGDPGLHVAVIWQYNEARLFLFGHLVDTTFILTESGAEAASGSSMA
jgi:hypothetical protein